MGEARDFSNRTLRFACLLASAFALAACEEGAGGLASKTETQKPAAAVASGNTSKAAGRDVESPEVFSVSEAGLWDGRPSLGGVWVAYPDVTTPERVIIRNTANGKSVTGALFRREREIPGPRLQASSDAAAALGMLAGAPVKLNVVALRREEVKPESELSPEVAVAAATPTGEAKKPSETAATAPIPAVTGDLAGTEVAEAPPKQEPFFKKLFGRKPAEDAATDSAAAASTPTATPDEDRKSAGETPTARSVPRPPPVAAKPLAPSKAAEAPATTAETTIAETATDQSEPQARKPLFGGLFGKKKTDDVGEPLSVLAPAASSTATAAPAAAAPAAPPKRSTLGQPYVQIGTFGQSENAERAADRLRKAGVVPTVREVSVNGKKAWRVIVGPALSASERDTLLSQVRAAGFSDAYAVKN